MSTPRFQYRMVKDQPPREVWEMEVTYYLEQLGVKNGAHIIDDAILTYYYDTLHTPEGFITREFNQSFISKMSGEMSHNG